MGLGVQLRRGSYVLSHLKRWPARGIAQAKVGGETTVTLFYDDASRGCGAYRAAEDTVRSAPRQWRDGPQSLGVWNLEGVYTPPGCAQASG